MTIIYLDVISLKRSSRLLRPADHGYSLPRRCSGWGLQGRYVSTPPVSSYLAFSSLPFRAVFFSVALSLKLPSPGTARHPVLWSPDFPHAPPSPGTARHPVLWSPDFPHAPYFRNVGARDCLGLPEKHRYFNNKTA